VKEQRGFLLRAGEGNSKITLVFLSEHSRRRQTSSDQFFNAAIAQWLGFNSVKSSRRFTLRQELNRSDAIAADLLQEIERVGGVSRELRADPAADGSGVREEVVKVVLHLRTADRLIAGRERERERKGPAGL
jgi:hypothetical protein